MPRNTCEACRFWDTTGYDHQGGCHRFPASVALSLLEAVGKFLVGQLDRPFRPGSVPESWTWPTTAPYDWCGEWQERKEGDEEDNNDER